VSTAEIVVTLIGLGLISALTRSFFMLGREELPIPPWLQEGLRHAPLAALAAVVIPEVVMTQGQLIDTWRDARPYAAVVAGAYFLWHRGILGTIVTGTTVFLALRLGLGW
jgi:branched-subunit amino acid transport protein